MEMMTNVAKPKQIRYAYYLLWGCLLLAFVLRVLDAESLDGKFVTNFFSSGYFLVVALYAYLFVGISKGRNSARILLFFLFALGLFFAPPTLSGIEHAPVTKSIEIAQAAMQILALYWIFTAPGKDWFTGRNAPGLQGAGQLRAESTNSSLDLLRAIQAKNEKDGR